MDVPVVDRSNRRQTQTPAHQAPPCTLVIFGAGGDLTKRLLMPAIYNLAKDRLLSDKFAIIAVDRTPKPVDAFRDYLADGVGTRNRALRQKRLGIRCLSYHSLRGRPHCA